MRQTCYFLIYILAAVFVFTGTAVPAPKRPITVAELALYNEPDRQQILEEGAKKEGKLTFYTSGVLTQAVRPVVDAFQKKYPYIQVEIWRSGTVTLIPRILEEYKGGKHLCDVIESTQLTQLMLQNGGITQPFYSPNIAYIQEGAFTKAPGGGVFRAAFRESGVGLGYNTKLITREEVPKTHQDLLNPKWNGKWALGIGNTGWDWMGTMLVTYGEDFVKQVAKMKYDIHTESVAAIIFMIINGEYVFSPTIFDSHVKNNNQKGAPIDWVPLEPVHVNLGQIALYRRSSHPHSALLFIDFELSKEAAEIHEKTGYNPTRKDVKGVTTYKKYYGVQSVEEGIKLEELYQKLFIKK